MRRLALHLLLALALALAGPAAYAHALTHLGDAALPAHHAAECDDDEGAGHDGEHAGQACALCAAFNGADLLFCAGALVAAAQGPHARRVAVTPHDRLSPCEALARFAIRAPPFPR